LKDFLDITLENWNQRYRSQIKAHGFVPIRGQGIETLRLSPRTKNALLKKGIDTVTELSETPLNELAGIRGIGPLAMREIKIAISEPTPEYKR